MRISTPDGPHTTVVHNTAAAAVLLSACVILLPLAGCGGSDRLPTAKVSGTVTLDGNPLPKGRISFVPQDGSGRPASGQIAGDGSFVLGTYEESDGAVLGRHKVSLVAREERGALPPDDGGAKSLIPESYGNVATSGLAFDVTADGDNVFHIELSSQGP